MIVHCFVQAKMNASRGESMPAAMRAPPSRDVPMRSMSPSPVPPGSPRQGKSKPRAMPGFVPRQEVSNTSVFDLGFSKM